MPSWLHWPFSPSKMLFLYFWDNWVYVGLCWGRKTFLRFLGFEVIIALLLGGIFSWYFGPFEMFFNMFLVPGNHPGQKGAGKLVLFALHFTLSCSVFYFLIFWLLFTSKTVFPKKWGQWREWLRQHSWSLLVLVAIVLTPMSIMGRYKIGGDVNSYHSIYYLIAVVTLLLVRTTTESLNQNEPWGSGRILLLTVLVVLCSPIPKLTHLKLLPKLYQNPQEKAYRFARANPGKVYLPWNPMVTLMSEGELYHFFLWSLRP